MIRLVLRLLYNLTVYPAALLLRWLRRRLVLRRTRAAALRLTRMPRVGSGSRFRRRASLAALGGALDEAAADPLVRGLFVTVDAFAATADECCELAALLERFKRSGKPLHVFAEHVHWHTLVAARAADRFTTRAAGPVMVHGIGVEVPFFGELLERHGVAVDALQRGDYKGAIEPVVRREPSPAFLESTQALVDDLFERAAGEIAKRPGWEVAAARTALEEGPYTIAQAAERRLIDAAVPAEQAEQDLAALCAPATRPRSDGAPPQLPVLERAGIVRPRPLALRRRPRLAFVPVAGLIVDRPIGAGRQAAVASDLAPTIRRLGDARGVEAIVLAIDSRGGSASASDIIWSAARYAGTRKPVIAWMRTYAASGGYYVAAAAARILASPFTITGSIGVIAAKPNLAEAARRAGVRAISVVRGRGAVLFSPFRPFAPPELEWMNRYLDEAYQRFKEVVAEGRRMPIDEVEQAARGRVWTGPQAIERKLVDGLGTYWDVVAAARELAGIPARTRHEVHWAAPRESLVQMARRMAGAASSPVWPAELDGLAEPLLLAREATGVLYYMPAVWE